MYALGFWDDDEQTWSVEFMTPDFNEAVENLADAREDARNKVYHWVGATLMVLVRGDDGFEEWQPLVDDIIKETTDDAEDQTS